MMVLVLAVVDRGERHKAAAQTKHCERHAKSEGAESGEKKKKKKMKRRRRR